MTRVDKKFEKELVDNGVMTQEECEEVKKQIEKELQDAFDKSKTEEFNINDWVTPEWEGIKKVEGKGRETGVAINYLKDLGEQITKLNDMTFHPQIVKIYQMRQKSIQEGKQIDWGTAEALAFASLLKEGFQIRLSGQDCERGTFSHRHAVIFDQNKDQRYTPINNVIPNTHMPKF